METKELNFVQDGAVWKTEFVSEGPCIVQMDRETNATIRVWANIEGMNKVPVKDFRNLLDVNMIFELKIPAGLQVLIESWSEVTQAKAFTE